MPTDQWRALIARARTEAREIREAQAAGDRLGDLDHLLDELADALERCATTGRARRATA
jgi:hypothetical protein